MNPAEKQRFAEYLFDEIGAIEDRYVAEAATVWRPTRKPFALRRILIVTATLSLFLTSALGLLIANGFRQKSDAENAPSNEMLGEAEDLVGNTSSDLSLSLCSLREETASLRTAHENINLFDGRAQVIWKYSDEEDYRVQTLTDEQFKGLTDRLSSQSGVEISPEESSAKNDLDGVWIAFGNGTVISPCLERTPGNVGYGTLFDYDPELEPSSAFTDYLCGILS